MEKILYEDFRKRKYKELDKQKDNIQVLMEYLKYPISLTEEDIMRFEDLKNNVINNINSISLDVKIEYEKTK
ncbi:MAG: hypothetical protein ACRCX8_11425 [Sarcina sp.]